MLERTFSFFPILYLLHSTKLELTRVNKRGWSREFLSFRSNFEWVTSDAFLLRARLHFMKSHKLGADRNGQQYHIFLAMQPFLVLLLGCRKLLSLQIFFQTFQNIISHDSNGFSSIGTWCKKNRGFFLYAFVSTS